MLLNNFSELIPFLKPLGSEIAKFKELDDGSQVVIKRVKSVETRKSGDGQYALLDCEVNGESTVFFAPGEVSDWDGSDFYPLTVTKQGSQIEFEYKGQKAAFPLGSTYKKLKELEEGSSYKVTGYSISDGKFGDNVVIDVEDVGKVNANAAIKSVLFSQVGATNDGGQQHSITATLHVDSIVKKGDKTYVNVRMPIESDRSKALAAKLGL